MKPSFEQGLGLIYLVLLRCASLLVPGNQRAEWRREWNSELWHVRHSCAPIDGVSWRAEREVTSFCLGAFQDAFCLMRHRAQADRSLTASQGSASHCMLVLGAVLAASYSMTLLLPGVRAEHFLSKYRADPGMVMIQNANSRKAGPTISSKQFRAWAGRRQKYFDGLAFYRITPEAVSIAPQFQTGWEVAGASSNLFALLGLPTRFEAPADEAASDLPRVILSDAVWKRDFGGNPNVAGSIVSLGSRRAKIVGVAPAGSWRLPGRVDAWLLEPDSQLAAEGEGYVVAHLTALGRAEMWTTRVPITAYKANDYEDELLGVSLDRNVPSPWIVFLFAVLLALLALPAITSVSLGENSVSSHPTSWPRRLYRWGFLVAKIVLLMPIVYFASIDMAYWNVAITPSSSVYIQLTASFSICLFGLCWVLKDQRQRCPVCLRRVEHPAQVGQASRTFLDWNGTELMCMDGHTLLHVPGLPTSWFGTQRWLYLDTSWGFLFAGQGAQIKNEIV
jgi:hypothetical protein